MNSNLARLVWRSRSTFTLVSGVPGSLTCPLTRPAADTTDLLRFRQSDFGQ